MARRNNNAAGVLILGLLAVGLALTIMRYTWPLLFAGSAGCLGTYLMQVRKDRRTAAELRETKEHQERVLHDREHTSQLLAAAQPQTPEDTFATCPRCGYTTMQMIFAQTDAGTTRRCVSCGHDWTIKHQKRVS